MQLRNRLGHFWLPEDSADVVPGFVAFDESGVTLQLLGLFKTDERDSGVPGDLYHPVVVGDLENHREPVSVFGCESVFTGGTGWSMYRANAALIGAWTDASGSLNIRDVAFELTGLGLLLPWADIELTLTQSNEDTKVVVEAGPERHVSCDLGAGLSLHVQTGIAVSTGAGASTALWAYHHASISADTARPFEELVEAVRAVRDLAEVLTGRRQQLSDLRFNARGDSGARQRLNFLYPRLEQPVVTAEGQDSRARSTITISACDVMERVGSDPDQWSWSQGLSQLAGEWMPWRSTHERAVANLREPVLRAVPTPWDWLLSNFAAAETYAKERFGATVEDAEHAQRAKAVLDALPPDLPERPWVESLVAKRVKGQERLMQELLAHVKADMLTGDPRQFARTVNSLRGPGSHGEKVARNDIVDGCAQRLRLVVLLAYLTDVGCPPAVLATLIEELPGRIH